jgi:hypothetical protein
MRVAAGHAEAGQEAEQAMQVSSSGSTDLHALVMFVVDASKPFSSPAATLTAVTGSWWPIAVMLITYSLITLVSAYLAPETRGRDLVRLEAAIVKPGSNAAHIDLVTAQVDAFVERLRRLREPRDAEPA